MTAPQSARDWFKSDAAAVVYIALADLVIHLLFITEYGYFRDELYYIACSNHLAWGYVDQPPLSIILLAGIRGVLGDSLFAIRILPVLAGSVLVVSTGYMAKQFGGGRSAQILASLATLTCPVIMGNAGRVFSVNAFDLLFWALAASIAIRIVTTDGTRLWILFGVVAGLGMLNKYSMGFFVFALVVGMLFTPSRKHFLKPWFWVGGILAGLIFLPHALWEIRNGYPTLEFIHNATSLKNNPITPWDFFRGQFMEAGPTNAIVWLAGLALLLLMKSGKPVRVFGITYLTVFVVMAVQNAKVYYLSPIYPMLFAAGGCSIVEVAGKVSLRWVKPAVATALVVGGIFALPFGIPVLPVESFIKYQAFLGIAPAREERGPAGLLPQYYADMFGWPEMIDTIGHIYGGLSAHEQSVCSIYARNYGEAAAVDFFGGKYRLPAPACTHNNYWFWKPDRWTGEVTIVFGGSNDTTECFEDLRGVFDKVELVAVTHCRYAMPYESHRPIFLCRGARMTLEQIWARDRQFI